MTKQEALARVQRGLSLINREVPNWKIDIANLDMSDDHFCILGQLFGSYDHGVNCLFHVNLDDGGNSAVQYGFMIECVSGASYGDEWSLLQEAWVETTRMSGLSHEVFRSG